VEAADGTCACPEGSVPALNHCAPCGEHELARAGVCECEDGYARATSSAPCTESDTGSVELGDSCTASVECAGDALCDVHGAGVCSAPPAGYGQPCTRADDCAATEATYCDTFSSHTCQLQGCKQAGGRCAGDLACCDFGVIGVSLCIPADALDEGECPAPGELVPREETP